MMRRATALVLSCAALSGCSGTPSMPSLSLPSVNMPSFNAPGTPVHVTSIPPGAEASFGSDGQRCTTPCTLSAPNGTGTHNVSFKLNGYQPQSVPVRITMSESSTMQSGDAGIAPDHGHHARSGHGRTPAVCAGSHETARRAHKCKARHENRYNLLIAARSSPPPPPPPLRPVQRRSGRSRTGFVDSAS